MQAAAVESAEPVPPLRIDIGCGKNKKEGFVGLDQLVFEGVDHIVRNLGCDVWPFADGTVDEAYSSHFLEHLTATERIHFANELYRVLKPGAKCTLIVPHWASCRAYGDPTHQWPPVSEFWFYYLSEKWRDENAPHTDYRWKTNGFRCDFEATWGYGMNPLLASRNTEFQQFALNFYKEAIQDLHATLTKR